MNLKEYLEQVKKLYDKYGDVKVIYAIDEEGNGFSEVCLPATPGRFEDGEFITTDDCTTDEVNCICVN